jgi:poly-gamma-glutamate capsule biosynthesis protein CapA/YwtB (metallophosphatase superfamily)
MVAQKVSRFFRSKLGLFLFVVIIAGASAVAYYFLRPKASESTKSVTESQTTEPQTLQSNPDTIYMQATGDFIAHDSVNEQAEGANGTYDYMQFMTAMKPYFDDYDINFCNQATLAGGAEYNISGYPVFNAPLEWTRDMRSLGCNLINVGTNHTNDKGQAPITAQLNEWDEQENVLAIAGANRSAAEQAAVRYFTVKGVKFAFLSYSTYSNAPNPNPYSLNRFTEPLVTNQMTEARSNADVVVVSMRWGTEYSSSVNTSQDEQAKKLAGLGADIILGHGPHVLQPVKLLTGKDGRETITWFSLGNFLNTQLETEALTGCVAQFGIDVASKKVTGSNCLPFYMHYEWTAEEKAAEELLARKNLQILPLYKAEQLITQSQLGTTMQEQMSRIREIVNTYTKIQVLNADGL